MCPNQFKVAARKAGQYFPLWTDDLPEVKHLFFDLNDSIQSLFIRSRQSLFFQLGNLQGELIQSGFVIFHDRIEQRVGDTIWGARDVHRASKTSIGSSLDAFQRHIVVSDQKVFTQEEVQFAGRKYAIATAVIHSVNHHEKIG